jgi:hypothetical protein
VKFSDFGLFLPRKKVFFKDDCTLQALAEMNGKTVYIRPEVGGSPLLIFLRNHTLGD